MVASVIVMSIVAIGCSSSQGREESPSSAADSSQAVASTSSPNPEAPGGLQVLQQTTIDGSEGGTIEFEGTAVRVPPKVSSGDLDVVVRSSVPVELHELAGPVVEINHPSPIDAPVIVEWNVSHLTAVQLDSLMLVRWDDEADAWLVEDQPYELIDGVLRSSIDRWSFWSWIASASQEAQELVGRRKDPPRCEREWPNWVENATSPNADTSAAAVLVCVEDDPGDPDVLTMRIVSNRTAAQIIHVGGDEPPAWVWEGELPLDVASAVHSAASAVLTSSQIVVVPPLHEIAIGIRRPADPGSQLLEFSNEVTATTLLIDAVAFAGARVPVGDAFENPLTAIFFEFVIECGVAEVARSTGSLREMTTSIVGAVVSCVGELTSDESELGRRLQQAVVERIDSYRSPEAARAAIKADRVLQAAGRLLRALEYAELWAYFNDVVLEAVVGPVTWGLTLSGTPRAPGDWTPNCSDVESDRQAWSRNWVLQPVFNEPPLRDFHTYAELPGVLAAASEPLSQCNIEHVVAVREDMARSDFQTEETKSIALSVVDELLQRMAEEEAQEETALNPTVEEALRNIEVPSLCGHAAGRLVDGELPIEQDPAVGDRGYVSMNTGYVASDVDGDGIDEFATTISCSQGGVSWPGRILLHRADYSVRTILDPSVLWEGWGVWRGGPTSVEATDFGFAFTYYIEFSAMEPPVDTYGSVDDFDCVYVGDLDTGDPYDVNPTTGGPCGVQTSADPGSSVTESAATELVRTYLLAAGDRRYEEAWGLLASGYQAEYGSYEKFTRFWDTIDIVGINSSKVSWSGTDGLTLELELWWKLASGTSQTEIVEIDVESIAGITLIADYRYLRRAP